MEIHAASWPSLEHELHTPSGDVGVTEQQDRPRQAPPSLDQQAADILKLFGESAEDSPPMGFDAFHFNDDTLATHLGAMQHDNETSHIDPLASSNSGSSGESSTWDSSNMAHHQSAPWPTFTDPLTFGYGQATLQPGAPWASEIPVDQRPTTFLCHGSQGLGIHMPPTSNPMGLPPNHQYGGGFAGHLSSPIDARDDYARQHFSNGWQQLMQNAAPAEDILGDEIEEEGADSADPCYAQLLHKCLKDAPHHTLSLRELYDWVSQHSQKAKDPNNRGWQNSVRHNLSMNAAFQRVTDRASSSSKKGSLWRLTDDALRDGVISTTRYRKDPKRKPERRAVPALNRQASGAKGGRATRDASRIRRHHNSLLSSPHNQQQQQQQQQQAGPYSPYSMISHSTPQSPQVHGFAPPFPPPTMSQAASPYFAINPSSPYEGYHQATPADFLQAPSKVTSFEFMPLPSGQGFFGDQDRKVDASATPTLTETSLGDDEVGF